MPPLLADPVRQVRMESARALAGEPEALLSPQQREAFAAALREYVAAERFNADRPEGRANLGNLHATQGRFDEAVAAYRSALALDPGFEPAALNLADVYRGGGLEADAERTLREALARDPRSASARARAGPVAGAPAAQRRVAAGAGRGGAAGARKCPFRVCACGGAERRRPARGGAAHAGSGPETPPRRPRPAAGPGPVRTRRRPARAGAGPCASPGRIGARQPGCAEARR
ncbi:MAG: tetratricopeptide repeat protein [Betaproteobacteria bacterium]|nr:tetratricopeptide repeat protein [Betaproteobacteria bacterium]